MNPDPTSNFNGFFRKYWWLLGGALVFVGAWFFLGRKHPAAATNGTTGIDPATGLPVPTGQVQFVPTTGDSYTNINYQSGNSLTDANNSHTPTPPPSQTPPPVPVPPSRTAFPPTNGVCPVGWHVASDGLCHVATTDVPSGGHTAFMPNPQGLCPTGWHVASDGLCHLLPTNPAPPPAGPGPQPVPTPTPTGTAATKAVSDWQAANGKNWIGPTGSFPYGWGPTPDAAGAGVVNNGVFSYVVQP